VVVVGALVVVGVAVGAVVVVTPAPQPETSSARARTGANKRVFFTVSTSGTNTLPGIHLQPGVLLQAKTRTTISVFE
jgi:hypothetical protein